MPLIYLNCPVDTFSSEAKSELAKELTTVALKVEKLPDTAFVRSTVWIYMNEYPAANVFHNGSSVGTKVISIEVNAFKGGLDRGAKLKLIEQFTELISKYAHINEDKPAPVYIVIRDIEEYDWGIFGKTITLEDVRNPPSDASPM